jgi:site-specific DNA-cytosine methylase
MGGGNRQPKVVTGAWRGRYKVDGVRQDHKGSVAGRTKQMLELRKDDKTNALTTVQKDNVVVEPEKMNWRKLSVVECERLQTVDDNYTEGVSNTQRYKMLGNGFTVEIISHILSNVSPGQQQKKVDS